ncbi:hypothetical protein KCV01_g3880, partial [Aureobasidium melanogenum]
MLHGEFAAGRILAPARSDQYAARPGKERLDRFRKIDALYDRACHGCVHRADLHSDGMGFPASTQEQGAATGRQYDKTDRHAHVKPERPHLRRYGEDPRQWYLQQPEAGEVGPGRRACVACAVERALQASAGGVERKRKSDDTHGACRFVHDLGIRRHRCRDRMRGGEKGHAHRAEHRQVDGRREADRARRAIRLSRAEVLADEHGGRPRHAKGRHQDELRRAQGDRAAGKRHVAGPCGDGIQADRAGRRHEHLQRAGPGDPEYPRHHRGNGEQMPPAEGNAVLRANEVHQLVRHAHATAGHRGHRRAGHPEALPVADTEDHQRRKSHVEGVGHPQRTHRNPGLTRGPQGGAANEHQDDRQIAREKHTRERRAVDRRGGVGADAHEHMLGHQAGRYADREGQPEGERDRLSRRCGRGARTARGADLTRGDGRCGDRQAEGERVDEAHRRLAQADRRDGGDAKARHPEDVDDGEYRFRDHFHGHGPRQPTYGDTDGALSPIDAPFATTP